jgi:pentatricopeptide repeat protein
MQLGDWEKALKLYKKIRSSRVRPTVSTFNALMTALCKFFQPVFFFSLIDVVFYVRSSPVCTIDLGTINWPPPLFFMLR